MNRTSRQLDATRGWFDTIAKDYDQTRPTYPDEVFRDIIHLTKLSSGGRVLEIGCGTGQVSLNLLKSGYSLLCIDSSSEMIARARLRLSGCANIEFQCARFEDFVNAGDAFDLVVSGTAFHWLDQDLAYEKCADLLKPSGHLALLWNLWANSKNVRLHNTIQGLIERNAPGVLIARIKAKGDVKKREILDTGLFDKVVSRRYPWAMKYDSETYIRLLKTYYDEALIDRAFVAIRRLIDAHPGGEITRGYTTALYVARKITKICVLDKSVS